MTEGGAEGERRGIEGERRGTEGERRDIEGERRGTDLSTVDWNYFVLKNIFGKFQETSMEKFLRLKFLCENSSRL
mgnify:CR=1 FL=1